MPSVAVCSAADSLIVEPTSGNTGVGLAIVAAVKGYRLLLVMPESMSLERRRLLAVYGADLELTPRELGMKGAIDRAQAIVADTPGAWMPQQFENEANVEVHRRETATEILRDFPDGIDYLITGVGTGGHITRCQRGAQGALPQASDVRGRAGGFAGDQRRGAGAASPAGHRRGLRARRTCTSTRSMASFR